MEMAAAKAGYDLARAEEEVADKAFLEAETLLKRREEEVGAHGQDAGDRHHAEAPRGS